MRRLAISACLILLPACAALVDEDEHIERELEQDFFLPHPTQDAWRATCDAAEAESATGGGRILVLDDEALLISWSSSLDTGVDKGEAAYAEASSLAERDLLDVARSVEALTHARVRSAPGGCRLRVRRTFYPTRELGGISPSSGAFERAFVQRVQEGL